MIGQLWVVRSHCIKVGELRFNLGNADGTVVGMLWKQSITTPTSSHIDQSMQGFAGILNALKALKRHQVLRWLTLFSDLMLDVLRFWHCTLWMSLVQIIRKRVLRSGMARCWL